MSSYTFTTGDLIPDELRGSIVRARVIVIDTGSNEYVKHVTLCECISILAVDATGNGIFIGETMGDVTIPMPRRKRRYDDSDEDDEDSVTVSEYVIPYSVEGAHAMIHAIN